MDIVCCINFSDDDNFVTDICNLKDVYKSDHLPITVKFDQSMIPAVSRNFIPDQERTGKIEWDNISEMSKIEYSEMCGACNIKFLSSRIVCSAKNENTTLKLIKLI